MFTLPLVLSISSAVLTVLAYSLFSWVSWSHSEKLEVPFIPTPIPSLPLISEKLSIRKGDVVYDIGCGDGRLLFYCARRHPDARFIGLEQNPYLIAWMRARKFATRAHNVEIRREDIFTADISDATRIYAFLLPEITDRFFRAGRFKGVRAVTRAFRINRLTPTETFRITPYDISYGGHAGHMAYTYEI